jgi:hypothetical protein
MRNLYQQFAELLAKPPLQVGTVTAIDDDVATVALPGGGVLKARGEATVGQKVFVRDDVIEGVAPDLPLEVIEI